MDAAYVLGIPEIDKQHSRLFELNNRIKAILAGVEQGSAKDIAAELYDYVLTHLSYEEKLIECWESYYSHVNEHRRLTFNLDNLFEKINRQHLYRESADGYLQELAEFINNWLNVHIKEEDVLYVPYLLSRS